MWTGTANPSSPPHPSVMGRRREKNLHLPPRMQLRGRTYYYVTSAQPRVWVNLGQDLAVARLLWADLEDTTGSSSLRTVADLLDRFLALPSERSEGTRKQYRTWANAITARFGDHLVSALKRPEVAEWRDTMAHRPSWANGCLTILSLSYSKAQEWGWCEHDPTPKRLKVPKKEREFTREEFRAVHACAPRWLQDAMDLSYLTAARESDVVGLTWAKVDQERVRIRQQKTKKRQAFVMNPALEELLKRCRSRRIVGLYVIADDKGRPISVGRVQEWFQTAREKAGVAYCTFHDIRSLAGTDKKKAGGDYQGLMGHATKRQADDYIRGYVDEDVLPNEQIL